MTKHTLNKEEYLSKVNEIKTPDENPKTLTDIDFFTVARERRSVRQYNPDFIISDFNIPQNLKPVMLISLGQGVKAGFEKVRLPLDSILTWKKF